MLTDALSVGLYVERRFHDYYGEHQHELGVGSNSFEDWAHRQIDMWNEMHGRARYQESPDGVLDRVRLDRVHVVPDGSLPLDPSPVPFGDFDSTQARPNIYDATVDLQWGFLSRLTDSGLYDDHNTVSLQNQFYFSGFLQHELGHARYLVDVHAWNVHSDTDGDRIEMTEGGARVAGSKWMRGQS